MILEIDLINKTLKSLGILLELSPCFLLILSTIYDEYIMLAIFLYLLNFFRVIYFDLKINRIYENEYYEYNNFEFYLQNKSHLYYDRKRVLAKCA